jgi:hypothetical protein
MNQYIPINANKPYDYSVKYEANPDYCRDVVVIKSGSNSSGSFLPSTTLLGKVTSTGYFAPLNPSATDGTAVAAGVLVSSQIDASSSTVTAVMLSRGPALINFEQLNLVNTMTTGQVSSAKSTLLGLQIKCEQGV